MTGALALARRDDAAALSARVASSAASGVARRALVLRLSRLPASCAQPHHLRLARAALDPLRMADRAESFDLPNADLAVLWRGSGGAALPAALRAVAELFAGAPPPAPDPASLCLLLDLPAQAAALIELARASRAMPTAPAPSADLPPLDPAGLAALEAALARADLARFVRRRPVCTLGADGRLRLAFDRRIVSLRELAAELAPGRSLRPESWLVRRLARTLDRRMLALLAAPGELVGAGPFAMDLTVAGTLGPEFLRFDATLPAPLRGRVAIVLQAADVLADLPAFLFARGFAEARGYRLVLDGITGDLAPALPAGRLGVSLLRFRWSPRLAGNGPEQFGDDPARVVLADSDTEEAIVWGRQCGIALFEGRAATPQQGLRS